MVSIKARKERIVVRLPVNDLKRPRARCNLREVSRFSIKRSRTEHRAPPARHTIDQHGDRSLEIQMERVVIVRLITDKPRVNARDQITIEGRWLVPHVRHAVEILSRRMCIEGNPVMELHPLLQMKNPLRLLRIRLPRLGEHRHDFPIIRNPDQRLPSL